MTETATHINTSELSYCNISQNRYCIKTGKPLLPIPYTELIQLIEIHGEERARLVITKLQYSTSLEWVLTDDIALKNLAYEQPVEYLIYALSALLPKPIAENTMQLIEDVKVKIKINQFLHTLPYVQIANTAELTRRILATNRPIAIQEMIDNCELSSICESMDSLIQFQLTLQACLKQIGIGYYDDKLVSQRNRQKKELFARQKQLVAMTELEREIHESIPDFDEINAPLSELKEILLKSTTRKLKNMEQVQRDKRKAINAKSSLASHENTFKGKFAGLKFGSKK